MSNVEKIVIVGGGPVGSLLSIYLSRKKFPVEIYEKRPDLRISQTTEGRSINLALSHRGLHALKEIGLEDAVKKISIPMKGRMIHHESGTLHFQPYGEEGQFINSISRNELNRLLIQKAEDAGVKFFFNAHCDSIDPVAPSANFTLDEKKITVQPGHLFGADGAFSQVRNSFKQISGFSFDQATLTHGYKELHIPPSGSGGHQLEKNALHIWPREQFMLIALPNLDGSFTATLFLPFSGTLSFETIKTEEDVVGFFEKFFPDALALMPDLKREYFALPASWLVTVHCFPWIYEHKVALIGDAAHAITPFYGQGMNAGFEDCRILNQILETKQGDWKTILEDYQTQRKENADAIADLALQNFIEMRDLVGDPEFILRKQIEAKIHTLYPDYLPLYSMVTFSDLPYKDAQIKGKEHDQMMQKVMSIKNIRDLWQTPEGWKDIEKIISPYLSKKG